MTNINILLLVRPMAVLCRIVPFTLEAMTVGPKTSMKKMLLEWLRLFMSGKVVLPTMGSPMSIPTWLGMWSDALFFLGVDRDVCMVDTCVPMPPCVDADVLMVDCDGGDVAMSDDVPVRL